MQVMIFLTLLSVISIVYATTSTDLLLSESRKNVRQSSTPSHLNSLASSQDGPTKQQPQQQAQQLQQQQSYNTQQQQSYNTQQQQQQSYNTQQQQQQSYNTQQQDYTNSGQPHSAIYNHIQSGSAPSPTPQNGYIFSVNAQNGQHGVGPTPVIMQYLPQNQQSAGGIQYLQLIPTRPLIVPISPYITQLPQYGGSSAAQQTTAQYTAAQPTAAQYTAAAPTTYGATQSTSSHSYPSYQNPVGGYSSPVVSYFRPHSGIQIVDGPIDMSLNTNEYIPIQSEGVFKMRRA